MKQQYLSFQRFTRALDELIEHYPAHLSLDVIGKTWERRPIYAVSISDPAVDAAQNPALLLQGTLHAREWIGVELLTAFLQFVMSRVDFDPSIEKLLKTTTLYVIPCVNPDGYEFSQNFNSQWRKNRRRNSDGSFGVDLNRNFPIFFKKTFEMNKSTYGGTHPLSEPESQALAQFVEEHPNITIALDYHSQGNVFFPAHRGRHEAELESTDLNTLCANMAKKIFQITNRSYGIHRGKPPANMIHGSAREFYFSKGILSTVVEVGSKNIPDYMKVMRYNVQEQIPALMEAWQFARAYGHDTPARPEKFLPIFVGIDFVQLAWEYPTDRNVVFQIYRSEQHKFCVDSSTLIAETRTNRYVDQPLRQLTLYFYQIRALDIDSGQCGPFAPQTKVRTKGGPGMKCVMLKPTIGNAGFICQKNPLSREESFGKYSMFVGADTDRGQYLGGMLFETVLQPDTISILTAQLAIYPMNRVDATIEDFGEWTLHLVDLHKKEDIFIYEKIANAASLAKSPAISSESISQGIWHKWTFEDTDLILLQDALKAGFLAFRVNGPDHIPPGEARQLMQFDIGDGPFGGGFNFKPNLFITFRESSKEINIQSSSLRSVYPNGTLDDVLSIGLTRSKEPRYGEFSFDLTKLPSNLTIVKAKIIFKNVTNLSSNQEVRFAVEINEDEVVTYSNLHERNRQFFVNSEISSKDLIKEQSAFFNFDFLGRRHLETKASDSGLVHFILRITDPPNAQISSICVNWANKAEEVVLQISSVKKQLGLTGTVFSASATSSKLGIQIEWKVSCNSSTFAVVRNRFHPPVVPNDGVLVYSGDHLHFLDTQACPTIDTWYGLFLVDSTGRWLLLTTISYVAPAHASPLEYNSDEIDQLDLISGRK